MIVKIYTFYTLVVYVVLNKAIIEICNSFTNNRELQSNVIILGTIKIPVHSVQARWKPCYLSAAGTTVLKLV